MVRSRTSRRSTSVSRGRSSSSTTWESTVAVRARVVSVVALLVGVSSLAAATVVGVRASSAVNEARSAQQTTLMSASREAATLVVSQVDAVRAAAQQAAHDARVEAVAVAGSAATPAQLAAAREPLAFLAGIHPVQASLVRVRAVGGAEVLRVLDAEMTRQGVRTNELMERSDAGSPWAEKALAGAPGLVFTSPPHGLALLDTDVVTTAVSLGSGDRTVGTLEIETPVSWLTLKAGAPVSSLGQFELLRPEQAQNRLGAEAGATWSGLEDVGATTYAWSRAVFDNRSTDLVGPRLVCGGVPAGGRLRARGRAARRVPAGRARAAGAARHRRGGMGGGPRTAPAAARDGRGEPPAAGPPRRHVGRARPGRCRRPGGDPAGCGVRGRHAARDGRVVRLDARPAARARRAGPGARRRAGPGLRRAAGRRRAAGDRRHRAEQRGHRDDGDHRGARRDSGTDRTDLRAGRPGRDRDAAAHRGGAQCRHLVGRRHGRGGDPGGDHRRAGRRARRDRPGDRAHPRRDRRPGGAYEPARAERRDRGGPGRRARPGASPSSLPRYGGWPSGPAPPPPRSRASSPASGPSPARRCLPARRASARWTGPAASPTRRPQPSTGSPAWSTRPPWRHGRSRSRRSSSARPPTRSSSRWRRSRTPRASTRSAPGRRPRRPRSSPSSRRRCAAPSARSPWTPPPRRRWQTRPTGRPTSSHDAERSPELVPTP